MLRYILYLYKHKTTVYTLKRNFDQLIWQLDAASNNNTEIKNLKIKQPALIAGLTIIHYFPAEFRVDYTSHFISGKGFTQSHLYGIIENKSENEVQILLRQAPSFEIAYLLPLGILILTCFIFTCLLKRGFDSSLVTLMILEVAALSLFYFNRKMLSMLEDICIEYIRSGKEFTI